MAIHIGEKRRKRINENINTTEKDVITLKEKSPLNIWMGRRFRQLRINGEFSLKYFAHELKISRVALSNIEKGKQAISSKDIYNASRLICVTPAEFFPAVDPDGSFITISEYYERYGLSKLKEA